MILPKSGRRVKRNVTFGPPSGLDGESRDEPSTLASRARNTERLHMSSVLLASLRRYAQEAWTFVNSRTGRGVLKCSIAYLLGSMATFVPFIAAFLGQQDGKHMVATITVYFHPARSRGSMVEAVGCAIVAFLYAVFVCFSSMGVSILFGRTLGLVILGHVIVLIVFCGGGLGFVGWTKQRLGHPLVNISCSLTSLAIITVVTKEGAIQAAEFSDDKVVQVMKMIVMGVIATTAVSLIVSPVSAKTDLKNNLIQVTDCLGDLLTIITRGFLSGSEEELKQQRFLDASIKHKKALDSLTKNLKEAKYEHYMAGTERQYKLEAKIVHCIQRLAQNIGGLRSAATTQFLLLAQSGVSIPSTPSNSRISTPSSPLRFSPSLTNGSFSPYRERNVLSAIYEAFEAQPLEENVQTRQLSDNISLAPTLKTPFEIFSHFIVQLGPSMVGFIC